MAIEKRIEETTVETDPVAPQSVTTTKVVESPDHVAPIATDSTTVKTTQVVQPAVKVEHPQKTYQTKKTIFHTHQIIWYILALIEVLLGFRITLKALGANEFSGFTNLIYAITNPLAYPFQGILPTNATGGSVFEWSTIIAAIVYLLIAWGIVHLILLMKPVTPQEVINTVDNP